MTIMGRNPVSKLSLVMAALTALALAQPAFASDPPISGKKVRIFAPTGLPLSKVLEDLFGQIGLRVKVSSAIRDNIAGTWAVPANTLWAQIAKSNNLVAFYDGSVVRIYSASEVTTRNFGTLSPESVLKEARRQDLLGAGNSVKASENAVIASGVPAFLDRIGQLANATTAAKPAKVKAERATIATAPITPVPAAASGGSGGVSDIVSPIARSVPSQLAALPIGELRSEIIGRATPGNPYEIRRIYVKYAEIGDRTYETGEGTVVYPGLVAQLRRLMGLAADVKQQQIPSPSYSQENPPPGNNVFSPYGPYQPQVIVQQAPPAISPGKDVFEDPASKAIIIKDVASNMNSYLDFIRTADLPRHQIEMQATIVDVDAERTKALGIDWQFGFKALGGLFKVETVEPSQSNSNVNASFAKGNSEFVSAQITALSRNGYLKIVKNQTLSARDNEPATLDNRQTLVLPYSGQYSAGNQTFKVGTFMSVKPSITVEQDGVLVTMNIDLRDGRIAGAFGANAPILDEARVNNTIVVRLGESYIIGGISIESDTENRSKIPGLGDIPGAGQLFRKSNTSSRRFERVLIITPRVLSNQATGSITPTATNQPATAPIQPASNKKKKKKKDEQI